jgi:anaerobic magnesium-protoporphyrin IX monomethyl ester cyclase
LNILLVNPNNRIQSPYAGIEPPLWLGLIASDFIRQGKEVCILDAEALNLSVENTVREITLYNPKKVILIVMGNNPSVSTTPKMVVTKKIVDRLIGDVPLYVTGLHPSALPKQTHDELGIEVLRGKIFEGTPDIPFNLMPMNQYQAHIWHCLDGSPRKPYASTFTSLNCPFACKECNIAPLYNWSKKVWYRDINSLIKEIDLLVNKYNVRNIKFWDEMFTLNKNRVNEICDKLIERKYDLNIWAYARVDSVTPELLFKMKQAGIKWVAYGYESGCDDILGNIEKKATKDQAIRATEWAHSVGINIIGNFIYGIEGDNQQTMRQTLDFAKSLNLEFVNFYHMERLPGSQIYDGENKDWSTFGQYTGKNKNEASEFCDKAFIEFFTDKNYLSNLKRQFGKQAVDQINAMLAFGKPKTVGAV